RLPRSTLFPYTTLFRSPPHLLVPGAPPSTTAAAPCRPIHRRAPRELPLGRCAPARRQGLRATGLGICRRCCKNARSLCCTIPRRSEEHTSELQSRENLV